MTQSRVSSKPTSLEVGQSFNPHRLFTGIFIPEALARCNLVSPGTKWAYGRLARYACQDGQCFPAVDTLAKEIGVGARQAQKYLGELENANRSAAGRRLWVGRTRRIPSSSCGVRCFEGGTIVHPKRVRLKRVILRNSYRPGLPTHESQKPRFADASSRAERCKPYARLTEALAVYMMSDSADEKVYPNRRLVVDAMDSAAGATEDDVLTVLGYPRN